MAYCTQTNIENRIGSARLLQLADLNNDGTVDSAVLSAAIEKADDLIDAYLRSRHEVPLSSVPVVVRELSVDLAVYFLHQAREQTLTDNVRQAYDDAVELLKNVARGLAGIDIGDAAEGVTEKPIPQVTTPLSTHDPVYRDKADDTSNVDDF